MSRSKGFTLAEMAVAVVILAILLFGAMVPFSTQLEIRNTADTRRAMDSITEAIIGFAQANGRLPCPANGATATGAAGAGTEQLTGNFCTSAVGVVPWATLGTPETDAWERRFTYRVSPVFADLAAATTWATSTGSTPASPANQNQPCTPTPLPTAPTTFALCSLGDIAIFTRATSMSTPLGSALPLIIISHGKNGRGAWQTNGVRIASAPAGTDEAANLAGTPTATPTGGYPSFAFYSRNPAPAAAGCADPTPPGTASGSPLCEFDDIVVTISSSALIARMVAAGKLP
jgi:prepilin-type N-terminal cleavage/methylation domain-containing protein